MNKAQRLQKGLTVALITVFSLGIVSTVGKMLNDKYDWIEKAKDLFVKPGETSEDPITSEDIPIETKLINVVVQKEFEFTESEFFAGASEPYLSFESSGGQFHRYDFQLGEINLFYIYPSATIQSNFVHYQYSQYTSMLHFPTNVSDLSINGSAYNLFEVAPAFMGFNDSHFIKLTSFVTDFDDVVTFNILENLSVDPADVLTDDDGQYVLDVDGVTKLYLYQV